MLRLPPCVQGLRGPKGTFVILWLLGKMVGSRLSLMAVANSSPNSLVEERVGSGSLCSNLISGGRSRTECPWCPQAR